jgi:hypothetical protein
MRKSLLSLTISVFALSLIVFTNDAFSKRAPTNFPKGPNEVCYKFLQYGTDMLKLEMTPGSRLVTGVLTYCDTGTSPGTSYTDAILVGSIQDVHRGNTIPYTGTCAPDPPLTLKTQIALTGSVASGNYNPPRAFPCWANLQFSDCEECGDMDRGQYIGHCDVSTFYPVECLEIEKVDCLTFEPDPCGPPED